MSASRLTLLTPGLLAPDVPIEALGGGDAPALERVLTRSVARPAGGTLEAALAEYLRWPTPDGRLPLAALTRLGLGGEPDARHWLFAEPVTLTPDLRDAVLQPLPPDSLSTQESRALLETLNAHLAGEGMGVEQLGAYWLLWSSRAPGIEREDPVTVAGRKIDTLLPAAAEDGAWRRLLTELQMLLHGHEVNLAREGMGKPSVNALWPWGGGRLPERPPDPGIRLAGDHPLVGGLSRLLGPAGTLPPADAEALLAATGRDQEWLVLYTDCRDALLRTDAQGWRAAALRLERTWVAPLSDATMRGRLGELQVDGGCGRAYGYRRGDRWRWWRRRGLAAARCP